MESVDPSRFLPIIQAAITPVILMSGTGMLMLTLTNRLGRIVDRTRTIAGQLRTVTGPDQGHLEHQLAILWRRAKLVRAAVTFAGLGMLVACLLVIAIFLSAVMARDFSLGLVVLFISSMALLIVALVAFLRDIFLSLHALRIEVDGARAGRSPV